MGNIAACTRVQGSWGLLWPATGVLIHLFVRTLTHPRPDPRTQIYVFGGYDGQRNHNMLHIFDSKTLRWSVLHAGGRAPPGASTLPSPCLLVS